MTDDIFKGKVNMSMQKKINEVTTKLSHQLIAKNLKLAVAESCTGGLIAKTLTDVSGSSEWFDCGVVSYSNQAKQSILKISSNILEQHGPVSSQVAEAMVSGLLSVSSASIAISTTGIAGPTGGTEDKPVGLVWFGLKRGDNVASSSSHIFAGSRDSIRQQAVLAGLQLVSLELSK